MGYLSYFMIFWQIFSMALLMVIAFLFIKLMIKASKALDKYLEEK